MSKFLDKFSKYAEWVVIVVSLLAYFGYQIMSFDGSIGTIARDPQSWIHLFFVVYLNQVILGASTNSAISYGVNCEEYKLAEELNNKIIKGYNNNSKKFRAYIKIMNDEEQKEMQDDFLFKVGDKELKDLTKKELRKYKKIKATTHDIYGFNLPLYYELARGNKITYKASVEKNKGMWKKRISKLFVGLLFGAMTVNMVFNFENVGNAFISLIIISSGLIITYFMTFIPMIYMFKYDIPKKVILKKTLFDGYKEYEERKGIVIEKETPIIELEEVATIEDTEKKEGE